MIWRYLANNVGTSWQFPSFMIFNNSYDFRALAAKPGTTYPGRLCSCWGWWWPCPRTSSWFPSFLILNLRFGALAAKPGTAYPGRLCSCWGWWWPCPRTSLLISFIPDIKFWGPGGQIWNYLRTQVILCSCWGWWWPRPRTSWRCPPFLIFNLRFRGPGGQTWNYLPR